MITTEQSILAAQYLISAFPGHGQERQHYHISAWQMAAEALGALGYADETSWGIVLRDHPLDPPILPRWDDVSVVVLLAAEQSGRIRLAGYHAPDILTGLGTTDTLTAATLEALGLVKDMAWTDAATEVLWRVAPDETSKEFRADDRLDHVLHDPVPSDVIFELERVEKIRSEIVRRNELEGLFFEHWRLSEGWLQDEKCGRALCIFHDPLAAEAARRLSPLLPFEEWGLISD